MILITAYFKKLMGFDLHYFYQYTLTCQITALNELECHPFWIPYECCLEHSYKVNEISMPCITFKKVLICNQICSSLQ